MDIESTAGTSSVGIFQALLGLIRTMRPKQWTKSGFIFVPLIFDRQLFLWEPFLRTFAGFWLLSLTASAVYIINDLVDIERDRAHPRKRNRPLPSGQLPVPVAVSAAAILPIVSLGLSWLLSPSLTLVLATYLALHILYSFVLKNVVIVDVLTISAGFVLRVAAGATLIEVQRFSPWMYVFTVMLALFLAVAKRRQEMVMLADEAHNHRSTYNEYNMALLDQMMNVVTTGTLVVYSLYTFEAAGVPQNHTMMLTIPFVLYGVFRYLYLMHVKGEGGAPDEVLLQDRPLQLDLMLWGLTVILILYVLPEDGNIAAFVQTLLHHGT